MVEHRLACGSGATFFLLSLLDHPDRTDDHLELMRHLGLGGSAVPTATGERAKKEGISIVRMYGSTEHPSITGSRHEDAERHRIATDGRPLDGVEIRLVDDDGRPVGPGEPGEIWSRGPDCCMGYTDPALTASLFDDEGWYRTEDIGVLDDDGYLTITDRKKDVIIRGGENVSAAEVEEHLAGLDGVAEVAVVAAPDARLGEQVCAFVRLLPGAAAPGLAGVREELRRAGLARQKWPEQLRVVEELPRTPSGKIKKTVLRQWLRDEAAPVAPGAD
jgi:acyl-CoA synthetase (AMP-forming)/AMP-acid ligase II